MYGIMTSDSPKSKLAEQIDENLKRVYDDALNEDIPDKFKQLLAQLRKKDEQGGLKS